MMGRLLAGTLIGLLTILLPACDSVSLEKLKPGLTTMQQTQEIMGPPAMEWQDADGSVTWEYPRMPNGIVNYMIDFGADKVLREVRQVLTDDNFARVRAGMTRDEVRRLLGQPARVETFANLREEVWEWRIEGVPHNEETYFNVFFDTGSGLVKKAGKRVAMKA